MSRAKPAAPTADEIAEMAARGEDISAYFTNKFIVVRSVREVNVGVTQPKDRNQGRKRKPAIERT